MSKRSLSEAWPLDTPENLDSVNLIIHQAEDLLRAAHDFKHGIMAGKPHEHGNADHLKSIVSEISSTLGNLDHEPSASHMKAIRLESSRSVSSQAPIAVTLTPWTQDDLQHRKPPLESIHNASLERAVFTHCGISRNVAENYERLEWIGDAYLYLMSSAFIYQTFPNLPAGRCSQYRELLVRNKTLARYTQEYQLERRLQLPPEFLGGNEFAPATKKVYDKIQGDLFEAYIAGVILGDADQGLRRASSWVKTLWTTELREELSKEFRYQQAAPRNSSLHIPGVQSPDSQAETTPQARIVEMNAKVQLAQAIGAKGIRIDYKDEGEPKKEKKTGLPWYTVGVYLDGWGVKSFKLGYGSAMSKKEAGTKAAQAALDNRKMISRFEQKKQEHDKKMKEQAAYAEWKA
ncbi:ribonuclease III domain-containing protein [Truncatella angustata]|uniref:Ribonuclease III domain-containing protein n=1 Tax=Truncatella angustata TaxID=152316 RepID=A0A9P8U944_9PEZI|nr:ribonuclease III domain-containing protein [Truncatella angustata]KAH6645889.1 ribonuclease III domain-containing protein [Truncatella angustata]KAH8205275.1 hypothetical protein TruAng_000522 [Truncatella angustata]